MPQDLVWKTYTGGQAEQVMRGLQILLDGNVLGEEEKKIAKRLQYRLRDSVSKGEGEISMVSFTEEENELINQVEAVLWR
jgi:hypothetical protein